MRFVYTPKHDYKVLVRCFTYNQNRYIEDALHGFAIQQMDFHIVCLVMDDCSTDGEQDTIKEWMIRECDLQNAEYMDLELSNVILVNHKTNTNCTFAFYFLKQNLFKDKYRKMGYVEPWRAHCKYEAFCEGDDFWIDPMKLQKQVEYMDTYPNCGLCYTDFNELIENEGRLKKSLFEKEHLFRPTNFREHLLNKCYIAPMTWLCRLSILKKIGDYGVHTDGTFALALEFFLHSEVHYISDVTATYRIAPGSAAHHTDPKKIFQYRKGVYDTQWIYAQKYGFSDIELQNLKASQYLSMIPFALDVNDSEFIEEAKDYCGKIGFNLQEYIAICRNRKQLVESPSYRLGNMLLTPLRKIHLDRLFTKYRR